MPVAPDSDPRKELFGSAPVRGPGRLPAAWAIAISVLGHLGVLNALMTPWDPSGSAATGALRPATDALHRERQDRPVVVEVRALPANQAPPSAPPDALNRAQRAERSEPAGPRQGPASLDGDPPTGHSSITRQAPAPLSAWAGSPASPGGETVATRPSPGSQAAAVTVGTAITSHAPVATSPVAASAASRAPTPAAAPPTEAAAGIGAGAGMGADRAAGAAATEEDQAPPPVYATRMPPPFHLAYALRRGGMSGQAELRLQRTGASYDLELKGTVLGMEVLGMGSRGGLGPLGLLPERFVDRRRGKDRLAANFDRGTGRITYSGTPAAQALLPGAQDRLSWMVQLAAVIEADPSRYVAGSRIAMSVSGARGDVDTWTFILQGRQRLNLPSGAGVETLRLTREPRRPYDTQVEVWLDPAQHHLPVRARLTVLPGGDTLELTQQPS